MPLNDVESEITRQPAPPATWPRSTNQPISVDVRSNVIF